MSDKIFPPRIGRVSTFVVAVWVGVFLVLPVATLIVADLGLHDVTRILGQLSTWRLLWFSAWQAAVSVLVTGLISAPITWLIGRHHFRGRSILRAVTTVGFLLPSVVVAAGIQAVLPSAMQYSVPAMVVGHAYFNMAVMVRVVGSRAELFDDRIVGAASLLGASPQFVWRTVVWQSFRGSVISASVVTFVFCFTSNAVVRLLGDPRRSTIESDIARRAFGIGDVSGATVLALLQLFTVAAILGLASARWAGNDRASQGTSPKLPGIPSQHRTTAGAIIVGTTGFVVAPLMALVWRSFHVGETFSLEAWRSIFEPMLLSTIRGTFRIALTAGVVGMSLCVLATLAIVQLPRFGRVVDALIMLPIAVSPVTVGLGLIITFDTGWFDWRAGWWLTVIAHSVVALPLAVRVLLPAWRTTPHGLHRAAANLGAGAWRRLVDVDLRRMKPAMTAACGLIVAVSLGEFGAASLLSRDGAETMPVAIARLLSRTGDAFRAQAFALASLLVIVCLMVLVTVEIALMRGSRAARR